tara:strand:- start:7034 stop:7843 length:810 start_codon:yes stop_codon:yes gene_type:complete
MKQIIPFLFILVCCTETNVLHTERGNNFDGFHGHFMQQRLLSTTLTDYLTDTSILQEWEWESWRNATVFRTVDGIRNPFKHLIYNEYGYLFYEKDYYDGNYCEKQLFDAWKPLSTICVINNDTTLVSYNWESDQLTATGPNGKEKYNRYGLISAKYDNHIATWIYNDISSNGRRLLIVRESVDCNGDRIIIHKNKWNWSSNIVEVLADPIVNDSCIVSGYRSKMITEYDRYYHVLNTDYFNRENENSDWIHYQKITTEYDYSHPFKGIE